MSIGELVGLKYFILSMMFVYVVFITVNTRIRKYTLRSSVPVTPGIRMHIEHVRFWKVT